MVANASPLINEHFRFKPTFFLFYLITGHLRTDIFTFNEFTFVLTNTSTHAQNKLFVPSKYIAM